MKYITYLVMCLVMLLAVPVVWAGQVGHTIDMPEYLPSVVLEYSPVVVADCRDVFGTCQLAVIYTKQTVSQNKIDKTETRIWAGNLLAGITGDINHKEAAVLMGKAEFSRWQSAETTYNIKSLQNHLAGRIV